MYFNHIACFVESTLSKVFIIFIIIIIIIIIITGKIVPFVIDE